MEKKISVPGYNFKSKTVRLHVDLSDKTTQLFKTSSACKNLTIFWMIHNSQIVRSTDSIYKYKSRALTVSAGEIRIEDPRLFACRGRKCGGARSQRHREGMLRERERENELEIAQGRRILPNRQP